MARRRTHTRHHPRSNPRGTIEVTASGFGFVKTAEGEFFIPASKTGSAFDGDLVEVAPVHTGNQARKKEGAPQRAPTMLPSARVVRVVGRGHETIIGRYEVAEPFGVVVPEDTRIHYDIFTMRADNPHINDGDIVRVRITTYPSRNESACGVIEEVIGSADTVGLDVQMIIERHKLETVFSQASLRQAQQARVQEQEAFAAGYHDDRPRFVFTIDPDDARDFDDAVSVDIVDGRVRLGVHIADVSHYVPWDSSIDLDARRRATSTYLVDRVVPMLPEELSNDICSLKPGEPRRTMTIDIFFDDAFNITHADFHTSVITSKYRLTYGQADKMLARNSPDSNEDPRLYERLRLLRDIAHARIRQRQAAGGLDFDTVEAKVTLDDEGEPVDVVLRRKTEATSCIEEAMILANECAARYLEKRGWPCIFRIHDQPDPQLLAELVAVLQEFPCGKNMDVEGFVAGVPAVVQQVLERAKGRNEERLVSSLVLRCMQRAVYSTENRGHYGLASQAYCHFTSPIRRYPDLVVHRMLKMAIEGDNTGLPAQQQSMAWIAEHSSKMERVAEAAARESQEMKLCVYMQQYLGTTFKGTISGVVTYGLYVQLENTAEGLVHVGTMGHEYFALDPVRHQLTGQDSGKTYRLGQPVEVVVYAIDTRASKIDFRLVDSDGY